MTQENSGDRRQKFGQAWIQSLMENLDAQLDERTRVKLMEACGRACARRSSVAAVARGCRGEVDKLLRELARHVGDGNARRDGKMVEPELCSAPQRGRSPVGEGPTQVVVGRT